MRSGLFLSLPLLLLLQFRCKWNEINFTICRLLWPDICLAVAFHDTQLREICQRLWLRANLRESPSRKPRKVHLKSREEQAKEMEREREKVVCAVGSGRVLLFYRATVPQLPPRAKVLPLLWLAHLIIRHNSCGSQTKLQHLAQQVARFVGIATVAVPTVRPPPPGSVSDSFGRAKLPFNGDLRLPERSYLRTGLSCWPLGCLLNSFRS